MSLVRRTGPVLDLACGSGRHTRLLLDRGHHVVALDRDVRGLADLTDLVGQGRLQMVEHDIEKDDDLPFPPASFAGVVVTNYLYRPVLDALVGVVAPGGVLIYETFARGNERFGRPSRPEFLLGPGELLDLVRGRLRVVAYEDVVTDGPRPAAVQHITAVREPTLAR